LAGSPVVAISFAYPPAMYPMSVLVSRLLRHSGLRWAVVRGDEGRPPDPGLGEMSRGEAVRTVTVPFVEPAWRLLLRRILGRTAFHDILEMPDVYAPWAGPAARAAIALFGTPDPLLVTFASPMTCHMAGLEVARRVPGLRWAAYFGDPWARNPMARRSPPAGRHAVLRERMVLERADLLLFPCEESAGLVLCGLPRRLAGKVRIATHGFEPGLHRRSSRTGGVVLRHVGSFYGSRTPAPLLGALRLMAGSGGLPEGLRVELIGPCSPPPDLSGLPEGLVSTAGEVPYLDSLEAMSDADGLILIEPSDPGSGAFLPSKLLDYLGAGRPILGIGGEGASRRIITALGGWTADLGDVRGIASGLAGMLGHIAVADRAAVWSAGPLRDSLSAVEAGGRFAGIIAELAGG
jgi:hypothetical protein